MKKVFKISFLLAISGLLSRLLGFVRDIWIGRVFGLQGEGLWNIDAYYVAFRVPDLLYQILIAGMISVSLIPVYYQVKEAKREVFLAQTARVLCGFLLLFAGLLYFTMPLWIPLLAPGLDPETQSIAMDLSRILLLSTFILGLSTFFQTMAQIQDRYWGMIFSPILYNLGAIFALYFLVDTYGVYGLIFGIFLGASLSLLVQLMYHKSWRSLFHTGSSFLKKEIYSLWVSARTRFLGIMILQAMMLLDMMWLSWMGKGSIALMTYLINIQSIILGLIAISTSTAIFNSLSQWKDQIKEWQKLVQNGFMLIVGALWPSAIGLYFVTGPLLEWILPQNEKVLLQNFSLPWLSLFLALNVIPIVVIHFLNRVYFSQNNYQKVNQLSLIMLCVYQVLLYFFFKTSSFNLIHLLSAFSLANYLVLFLYYQDIQKRFQFSLWNRQYFKELLSAFLSGILMALTLYFLPFKMDSLPTILACVGLAIMTFSFTLLAQWSLWKSPLLCRLGAKPKP